MNTIVAKAGRRQMVMQRLRNELKVKRGLVLGSIFTVVLALPVASAAHYLEAWQTIKQNSIECDYNDYVRTRITATADHWHWRTTTGPGQKWYYPHDGIYRVTEVNWVDLWILNYSLRNTSQHANSPSGTWATCI